MQDATLPVDDSNPVAVFAGQILEQCPTDRYPELAELTIDLVLQPGYDYGDEFEFGLDLILDGLSAHDGTQPRVPSKPP